MENQTEIIEVVEQGSSKKGILGKIAIVAAGAAAGFGAVMFFRKRKLAKQLANDETIDISEDSVQTESNES